MAGQTLMALGWLWWRAWFPFGEVVAAAVCVAGVALGDIEGVALMALGWLWWRAWFPWRLCRRSCLCGSVALGNNDLHFVDLHSAW